MKYTVRIGGYGSGISPRTLVVYAQSEAEARKQAEAMFINLVKKERDKMKSKKFDLAEALGVREDEIWGHYGSPGIYRVHCGVREVAKDPKTRKNILDPQEIEDPSKLRWSCGTSEYDLCTVLQTPENIFRLFAPPVRLTEAEMNIMRLTGAAWVSVDGSGENVDLWGKRPMLLETGRFYRGDAHIGFVQKSVFPSLEAGDCVYMDGRDAKDVKEV